MRHLIPATLCLVIASSPVRAEGDGSPREGLDLMERGAEMLLRGLIDQVDPMMRDFAEGLDPKLRSLFFEMGPMLEELADLVDDLSLYELPERLPNGDIILRRKQPESETAPDAPGLEGQIEL